MKVETGLFYGVCDILNELDGLCSTPITTLAGAERRRRAMIMLSRWFSQYNSGNLALLYRLLIPSVLDDSHIVIL